MERDALWRMVMDAKYGSMWGGWCSNSVQGPYEFCLWKSIRKGWDGYVSFRDESVADLLSLLGDSYHCNISFVRPAQDWELESVASFLYLSILVQ